VCCVHGQHAHALPHRRARAAFRARAGGQVDPRVGGRFEIFGGAVRATFTELSAQRIAFDWHFNSWREGVVSKARARMFFVNVRMGHMLLGRECGDCLRVHKRGGCPWVASSVYVVLALALRACVGACATAEAHRRGPPRTACQRASAHALHAWLRTQVTITLEEPSPGSTVLRLQHSGIPREDKFGGDAVETTRSGWRQQILHRIRAVFGYGL